MIPYIVFLLLILVFRHLKKPMLLYLTLLLFSMLRYDTGWDYMSYYTKAEMWGSETISWERFTVIWQWLFEIANKLKEPHLVLAVPAFLTITVFCYSVKLIQNDRQRICDSLTIYALWPFFYLASFSTIRQSLAISVGLLILYFAIKNKPIPFVLLLFINYFIHPSSIVCVCYAVFFLPNIKLNLWHYFFIIVTLFVLVRSVNFILSRTFLDQYLFYLENSDTFGSKLSILLAIILIPAIMIKNVKSNIISGHYSKILDITILTLIMTIIVYNITSNSILTRGISYFSILLVFIAPYFSALFHNKQIGSFLVYLSFSAVFIYYLLSTSDAMSLDMASSPYVPYKSILFR